MHSIQKYCVLLSAIVIASLIASSGHAQQSTAPQFKVTPLLKESLTGQPDKEVVMVIIEWPPGAGTGRHTHPGDEYATVLEGAITGQKEGAGAQTFNSGQSYHNEAGVVHEAKNAGNQPVKSVHIFVVEKGKPLIQPVK
jgi:quercetin dioxygenase-like cupin family protein